jgi:N-dimethylarginine dimethylaminohydrolase
MPRSPKSSAGRSSACSWSIRASTISIPRSRAQLETLFPDAIVVESADAYAFGLNAVSDGRHVVYPRAAVGFAEQLSQAGFEPFGVEMSELLKGGGSVKCCTLEVYS